MPKLIVGNWKMNCTVGESLILIRGLKNKIKMLEPSSAPTTSEIKTENGIAVCPPFTSLYAVSREIKKSNILLGAQNIHYGEKGAFTGEISPAMLKELGCRYVILGHSERRQYFFENDIIINKKVNAAINKGIIPILCVGERLEEREKNMQNNVVESQLVNALKNIKIKNESIVIAYEPVWAIGTGRNAAPQQAEEMHAFIRNILSKQFNAPKTKILYGGSVNDKNSKEILAQKNIDGALVGGASLKVESFIEIIKSG